MQSSLGSASAENQRPISIEVATAECYTGPPLHDFFMIRYTEAHPNGITGFIGAIESGARISPSREGGLLSNWRMQNLRVFSPGGRYMKATPGGAPPLHGRHRGPVPRSIRSWFYGSRDQGLAHGSRP